VPSRWCVDCRALFNKDDPRSPGLRCPACQAIATRRRNTDPPGRPSAAQRGYGAEWRRISARLIAAATHCAICGGEFTSADPATVDHITPKARGGTNDEQNLRVTHRSCNSRRGGQMAKRRRTSL
jgi:5-methylcytosine-specific restriction protein A